MNVLFALICSISILAVGANAAEGPVVRVAQAAGSQSRSGTAGRNLLRAGAQENYIGVVTAPVPPAVASQLAGVLEEGRGLLITQVLADSPAHQIGLRQYDILSTYNGQPLASSAKLKQLIAADEMGRSVELGIIRGGRPMEITVTLGRRAVVTQKRGGENGLPQLFQRLPAPKRAETGEKNERDPGSPAVARRPFDGPRNVTVVITQFDDAAELAVDIRLVDAQHQSQNWRFNGTKEKVLSQVNELPAAIHGTVRSSLQQAESIDGENRALRLQFRPQLDGEQRSYRILFCRPTDGGGTRVLGLEQSVGANDKQVLEQLLENQELNRELDALSPPVRSKLQGALRTLPVIEPPVDTSVSQ